MSDLNSLIFLRLKTSLRLPSKDCQQNISDIFSLNSINNPQTANLQKILQNYSDNDALEHIVDGQNLPFGNALKKFITGYLIMIRDFNPWSTLQSIDLMLNYYRHLTRCFESKDLTNILQKTMVDSTEYVTPLISKVDTKYSLVNNEYKKFSRLEYFTELLLSIFNKIIISKNLINENLLSYLAIKIMKIYFFLGKPRLCNNILTNIRNLGLGFQNISTSNKVNYKFLVGKFYFLQENFMRSFSEFQDCLNMLKLSVTPVKNLLIIIRYLIPNGIIVGKIPNMNNFMQLIQLTEQKNNDFTSTHFDVIQLYQPLVRYVMQGNLNGVNQYLYMHEGLLKSTKFLIVLIQRTRVITLRNLIHQIYLSNGSFSKHTLDFESIKIGLKVSIGEETFPISYKILIGDDGEINDIIIENILINLIDQNLIKANIFSRLKLVRFSKTNSFPNIYDVYNAKFS